MRLTTDTPKNNLEMALNLFYVKDKEVWVRGYGKNGADISLFDLSRDLTRWNCPYPDAESYLNKQFISTIEERGETV